MVNHKNDKSTGDCKANKETAHATKCLEDQMDVANGECRKPGTGKQYAPDDRLRVRYLINLRLYEEAQRLALFALRHHGGPDVERKEKAITFRR